MAKITLLTYGSRGDVQPYIALGMGLQHAGHTVRLAAPGIFVALILVYIPLFSEFATPALVGGRSGYMLGSLANSLILEQGDWGAGAALNFLLLAASGLVALAAYYLSKLNQLDT